jgi:hypothetical protein
VFFQLSHRAPRKTHPLAEAAIGALWGDSALGMRPATTAKYRWPVCVSRCSRKKVPGPLPEWLRSCRRVMIPPIYWWSLEKDKRTPPLATNRASKTQFRK